MGPDLPVAIILHRGPGESNGRLLRRTGLRQELAAGYSGEPIGLATGFRRLVVLRHVPLGVYTGGMAAATPKRRWCQFRLRTLLVAVTLCALACSWGAVKKMHAKRERDAAAELARLDGQLEWSEPSGWPFVRAMLGNDTFRHVRSVCLLDRKVTDSDLRHLKGMSRLEDLNLFRTQVTDVGMEHLRELSQLRALVLSYTQVGDNGLVYLKGCSQLRDLSLEGTRVTDAGLEHLNSLSQLNRWPLMIPQSRPPD
jgi:hypothetical protein